MNLPIKFGTDGWRGIIADTFTFECPACRTGTAGYFDSVKETERAVFIGFDGRFRSSEFARCAAEVFAEMVSVPC
jgi:phosphomannomutase